MRAIELLKNLKLRSNLCFWLIWHFILGVSFSLLLGQIQYGHSLVEYEHQELRFMGCLFFSYLMTCFVVLLRVKTRSKIDVLDLAMAVIGGVAVLVLSDRLFNLDVSRTGLLLFCICTSISVYLSVSLSSKWIVAGILLVSFSTIALQLLNEVPAKWFNGDLSKSPSSSAPETIVSNTNLYSVVTKYFDTPYQICSEDKVNCRWPRNGGGISEFRDGYLVVNGEGDLIFSKFVDTYSALEATTISTRVPMNTDGFINALEAQEMDVPSSLRLFRVTDIHVRESGGRIAAFVSHHYWNDALACFALRISRLDSSEDRIFSETPGSWETVFETSPCLPLVADWAISFRGDESGGRMVFVDDDTVLMTVGDHQFDGVNIDRQLAQEVESDYGKVLQIDLASGVADAFTVGHRNPQGLWMDRDGSLWSTEHGPKGGDELNLLGSGKNYGWPQVTYGTQYEGEDWPLSLTQGRHAAYEQPVFSWVPSIAISNLIRIQNPDLEKWVGDFLIGSYTEHLHRVKVIDGRVVLVEPIHLRPIARVRDLVESDGRFVMWLDRGVLAVMKVIVPDSGDGLAGLDDSAKSEILFGVCLACHQVENGEAHGIGPDLYGLFDRDKASAKGYEYSVAFDAMKDSWSREELDKYLAAPQEFASGTRMVMKVEDDLERRLIIDRLFELNE